MGRYGMMMRKDWMNLFREFFMMYKDLEWFNYWKLNLKEKWGYTKFISEWE